MQSTGVEESRQPTEAKHNTHKHVIRNPQHSPMQRLSSTVTIVFVTVPQLVHSITLGCLPNSLDESWCSTKGAESEYIGAFHESRFGLELIDTCISCGDDS